uniref:Uncharacterized protein n=1 Tax=Romanomermis culicivorax TaxID=13658 RepID=A0A915HEX3_ROMCU
MAMYNQSLFHRDPVVVTRYRLWGAGVNADSQFTSDCGFVAREAENIAGGGFLVGQVAVGSGGCYLAIGVGLGVP